MYHIDSELLGVSFTLGPEPDIITHDMYYIQLKDKTENTEFSDYTKVNYETVHPDNLDEVYSIHQQLKAQWFKIIQSMENLAVEGAFTSDEKKKEIENSLLQKFHTDS